jgi:hypothetical protein
VGHAGPTLFVVEELIIDNMVSFKNPAPTRSSAIPIPTRETGHFQARA